MKTFWVLLLQCLTLLSSVHAQQAYIYTHDVHPRSHSSTPQKVTSDTAQSIWSRRLGLLERRRLASEDESVLEQIAQYGGEQRPLFDATQTGLAKKLSIVVEGFDSDFKVLNDKPDLIVTKPTQDLAACVYTRTLIKSKTDIMVWTFETSDKTRVSFELGFANECNAACEEALNHQLSLENMEADHLQQLQASLSLGLDFLSPVGNEVEIATLRLHCSRLPTTQRITSIAQFISAMTPALARLASEGSQESTVVLLPSHSHLIKQATKRQNPDLPTDEEELLDIPSDTFPHTSSSNSTIPSGPPKLGPGVFLPICFRSNSSCNNATNACSGHGTCGNKTIDCYACSCGSTIVRTNDDGTTKSVQWGGLACEKKDVSVPFFLFASFGVVMTALVAGGIGMLWSMGAEELPSVIGAGVAGPRATK